MAFWNKKKKQKGSIRLISQEEAAPIKARQEAQAAARNKTKETGINEKGKISRKEGESQKDLTKRLRQSDKVGEKIKGVLGSTKTTGVLASTLATVATVGTATGALGAKAAQVGGKAVITRTATTLNTGKNAAGNLIRKGTTITTQRAIAGRQATTGVEKIFNAGNRAVATRFTTNAKSTGLTKAFLGKLGLTIGGASVLIGVIGSYPFAAFGKEEALQAMSFPMAKLIEAGKIDEAQELLDDSNLLIQEVPSKIPYKNVLDSFNNYAKAQTEANKGWQTLINNSREIAAGNETSEFEKSKEKSRQTELENMGKDAEYYKLIREGKFEEAEELRLIELEGGQ